MTIQFFSGILEYTNGETIFEPGPCKDMRGLVDALSARYGERFAMLIDRNECFFLVNGKGVMATGGLNTPLSPGDRIDALPFVDAG